MISLACKFHSFVVAAQGRQGSGRRLEGLGTQIGKHIGGEREMLLDGPCELRNGRQQCLFVGGLDFQRIGALVLQVA